MNRDKRFDKTRVNQRIRVPEVRLISADGKQMGVFQTRDALNKAHELGYDLVEISPTAKPPVCRLMDYGKYKYEMSKKQHEAKRKQVVVHVKEMKMRPGTGEHDLQVKISHLKRFLEHGDKAKITMVFRGREMAHIQVGERLMKRVINDLSDYGTIEQMPKLEGRAMVAVLGPVKK